MLEGVVNAVVMMQEVVNFFCFVVMSVVEETSKENIANFALARVRCVYSCCLYTCTIRSRKRYAIGAVKEGSIEVWKIKCKD